MLKRFVKCNAQHVSAVNASGDAIRDWCPRNKQWYAHGLEHECEVPKLMRPAPDPEIRKMGGPSGGALVAVMLGALIALIIFGAWRVHAQDIPQPPDSGTMFLAGRMSVPDNSGPNAVVAPMPNLKVTPGLTRPGCDQKVMCDPNFRTGSVRHTSEATKHKACAEYGVKGDCPDGNYEIDHLISLELCGADDIKNLWPEPYTSGVGAHEKDKVENYLHREVCGGRLPLKKAQDEIVHDWFGVYRSMGAQ